MHLVHRNIIQMQFNDLATFTALITCLCHLLNEHTKETSDIDSPICPKTRPLGEENALIVLLSVLPDNIPAALEAGIISRWLYRYPFPCLRGSWEPVVNVYNLTRLPYGADDAVLSSIVKALARNPEGARQLRKYGLMAWGNASDIDLVAINKSWRDLANERRARRARGEGEDPRLDDDDDVIMGNITEVETPPPSSRRARPLMRNLYADEQAVRRRRREAVVISDGNGPIQLSDIYSPAPAVGELDEGPGLDPRVDEI